ncbi:class I SAM-dependent methyltransferase [Aliamphritea ceti]|uniref:class I SAM-dependent methyltransferase n=1 Tax=Aliamphritea ceti TaxID=1524258 RepID=UPI0021C3D89F|nr:class I SAM-dependent methyltransferase [Aliamphritea ceti]
MKNKISGDTSNFDQSWRTRKEAKYNHWSRGNPANQIQFAFKNHFEVFSSLIGELSKTKGKSLEVGCGRGSLSSFFAEDGWECTLLDYSPSVIETAKDVFETNGHSAEFITGDANELPFEDETFDVTSSIGLLEHFEDVSRVMSEQVRVLKKDGWFLGYVVPERPDNVQRYFNWINSGLKLMSKLVGSRKGSQVEKPDIYRSDFSSEFYLRALEGLSVKNITVFGMYPMPMVSHSPEFPFSLLPKPAEVFLTKVFGGAVAIRNRLYGKHGWICDEKNGQAFLVAFQKS